MFCEVSLDDVKVMKYLLLAYDSSPKVDMVMICG